MMIWRGGTRSLKIWDVIDILVECHIHDQIRDIRRFVIPHCPKASLAFLHRCSVEIKIELKLLFAMDAFGTGVFESRPVEHTYGGVALETCVQSDFQVAMAFAVADRCFE